MTDSPQPQLRARPQALVMTVDDLVERTRAGRIRVPDFQRALKWEAADALKLLDSIDRGYPVGTLLFWQRESEAGLVRLGPREIHAAGRADAWFVIDGQQRLTALMRTLDASEQDPWRTAYDLDTRSFAVLRRTRPTARRVPVDVVFDQSRLLQWLTKEGGDTPDAERMALFDLTKRLQKYSLPVVVVEARSDEEDAIRDIFTRLNESGKRLDVHDAFRAFHERPASKTRNLDAVVDELCALGFGSFERDTLISFLATTREVDPGKLKEALQRADFVDDDTLPTLTRAVRGVVQFLQTDCAIPHLKLVPYAMVLQPLVRFFQLHPAPQPRTRELLRRYVWRGSVHRQFRADVANTRSHLDAVARDMNEHDAVQSLLRHVSSAPASPAASGAFGLQYATPRMDTLALLALGPRDFVDGHALTGDGRPFDAALLPPVLAAADMPDSGIWGRVVHDGSADVTAATIGCSDPEVLASHAIDKQAQTALSRGDLAQFLEARQRVLGPLRDAFFARMAVWSPADRDRPPLHTVRERAVRAAGSAR